MEAQDVRLDGAVLRRSRVRLPLLIANEPAAAFSTPVRQQFALLFTDADYAAEVQRTRAWLSTRFDWLDAQIAGL